MSVKELIHLLIKWELISIKELKYVLINWELIPTRKMGIDVC